MSEFLAPNGKPSNLTPEQYKLVRTSAFKKWFGDWENSPKKASKVVDENGEPLIMYHGTNAEFTIFDTDEDSKNRKGGIWNAEYPDGYIFMTSDKKRVKYYGERIIPLFVNMKYPTIKKVKKGESLVLPFDDEGLAYEGDAIVTDGNDYVVGTQDEFLVKLADGTNTTFDGINPDIRFEEGGSIPTNDFISDDLYDNNEKYYLKYTQQAQKYFSKKVTDDYWHFSVQYFNGSEITFEVYSEKGGYWLNFKVSKNNLIISSAKLVPIMKNGGDTKKVKFKIESREDEEDITTISINGIGEVVLVETFPEYEFLEDVGEEGLEKLGVEEGDIIGKIEHLEVKNEYKGIGYGKLLMKKAIEIAKEKGLMPLYLNASPMGSKQYGLDIDDLTSFYESFGFEVFLRQGGNNLMILKDTYKNGGLTKNKMDKKNKLSKDEMIDFNLWMQDGNVSKNADGSYSTQDAQWGNKLKDLDALKQYYVKEFLSGGRYAGGGQAGKIIMLKNPYNKRGVFFEYYAKENISKIMNNVPFRKFGNEFRKHIDQYFLAENNTHRLTMGMSWSELASYIIGDGSYNLTEKQYNDFIEEFNTDYENSYAREDEYENGGDTDDKHLIAKAIEYITGSAIESDTIQFEANNVAFKYKGKNVWSTLNKKLLDDTIRMHGKSLRGRFEKGGEASFDDAGTSMVMYHEEKGNFMFPKGLIYLWLYEGENASEKIESEEYDWVLYPFSSISMMSQRGFIPPLKKIWTKKFQKQNKGSEHLLGVIKAHLLNDGKELYIDMMSVNPTKKKKGVMSYMIKDLRDTYGLTQDQVTFSNLTDEGKKFVAKKTYADGGDVPHEDKMFQLPLEMVVYVPSTQDVDKVISVDKMDKRVDEVKEYLASKFGGYSSADKLGGFVDSTGTLVNEDVVQVTSFSTKEAYEENKEELIQQLAKWGKEWGQEAIGFEFEGDLMYVPQEL